LLFAHRAARFVALAAGHELEPYLRFLALIATAQHEIQPELPPARAPSGEEGEQAAKHGMPVVLHTDYQPDDVAETTIVRLLDRLVLGDAPTEATVVAESLRRASRSERSRMAALALKSPTPVDGAARHALLAAGLQVHFARLAAQLDAGRLKAVADAACPVCGSPPVTSAVVGWPKAHNTRFCACSLCGTMWNVVRVKCVICGSTDGISFRAIEGAPDTIKAETCEKCRSYVKVLYQVKDPALEPFADDVASLGLDMLLGQEGWKRGGRNPFLMGY
jgi:FdhE protein